MQVFHMDESAIKKAMAAYRKQLLDGTAKPVKTKAKTKIKINFHADAWAKQQRLIDDFNSEVAWHGTVNRTSNTEFEITDILVYPQQVTGATVNTDQGKYNNWLISQPDEVFNNIRYQAHSHVNFGPSPSGVDDENESRIYTQLQDNDYYLFMIWNKRGEFTVRLYDNVTNQIYDKDDIEVTYTDPLADFAAQAKDFVTTTTFTSNKAYAMSALYYDEHIRCWVDDEGNIYDKYPTHTK